MNARITRCLVLSALVVLPIAATAQSQSEIDAINRLIDRYGALEDAMDMTSQAQLMAPDRVQINQGGRRTNQALNMRIQQAQLEELKKALPGVQFFTEDRDRLIRFYGNGAVAVVSFYRYRTRVIPSSVPATVATSYPPPAPVVFTLVLEKRTGDWKIVHAHATPLPG
jgi:hypothetical protein